MKEANEWIVIGEFVSKDRLLGQSVALGLFQILESETAQVLGSQVVECFRKLCIIETIAADRICEFSENRQFLGAFNLTVTGENLLDQR